MELVENAPAIPIALTASQAQSVTRTSSQWRRKLRLREDPIQLSVCPDGTHLIQIRGVAGFIRVGDTTLEIAPKFLNKETAGPAWRAAMWRLLAYGRGIEALSDTAGSASKEDGVADVLADIFLASLQGASARGYPVGYQTAGFSTPFLRGRLNPREYHRLLPPNGKLHVLAPILTTDTPTNRLLKWAGAKLASTVEQPARRRQLLSWMTELPKVPALPPPRGAVPSPSRQHPYLVQAVDIAKLLLEDWEVGFERGELLLPGFLWDSENLFERAAMRLASEASHSIGLSVAKKAFPLLKFERGEPDARAYTIPDILVFSGNTPKLLMDAKYKMLEGHPKNSDVYQVLAGGRATEISSVALVYPGEDESITIGSYVPFGGGLPASMSTVKLGLNAFSSRAGVVALRASLATWMQSQVS